MEKKTILKYRSTDLSTRSGKTDEKKKKVEGIKIAAQKTSLSLKVASATAVARCKKKTKNIHTDITCAKKQNLLLITLAGFLKNTNTPSPAIRMQLKIDIIWVESIKYLKNISLTRERHVFHLHYGCL